ELLGYLEPLNAIDIDASELTEAFIDVIVLLIPLTFQSAEQDNEIINNMILPANLSMLPPLSKPGHILFFNYR
ncbi:hypothetical protein, partial [Escherichia coli]|uniref:hypothetical protein n=1 Tax=Escherichia coli TaxID=562 RepID=UPI001BDBD3D6